MSAPVTREAWCGESLAGHMQGLCHCQEIQALRQQLNAMALTQTGMAIDCQNMMEDRDKAEQQLATAQQELAHDVLIHRGQALLIERQDEQLATARQAVWEEAATVICVYCLRGDARRSWSHHTNGNVCAAERLWIEQARKKTP